MCGIIGIVAQTAVNQALYDGLTVLQHRGQDSAGMVTAEHGRLYMRKQNGMVRDVFGQQHMERLRGNMGIGHVRYPTAGSSASAEAQPFYVNSPYGITLAHNGNLTNTQALRQALTEDELRHLNTDSDSEVLLNVFAGELQRIGRVKAAHEDVFAAVRAVHRRCRGAYAVVAMITDFGVVGFRDPHGIRPLVIGVRETVLGDEYILASESVAIASGGYRVLRDVAPGEAVILDRLGKLHTRVCVDTPQLNPCLFELVYFARPDSIMDSISVHKCRMRMGEKLAHKLRRVWPEHDIDVVIPIPDTSRTAAMQLAAELGLKYREGFIKNRYIARTFIMPGQGERQRSVRQKLNPIELEFEGKNVLLVDDSIVRGTTSQQIVQLARDAGARRVYFASAAPAVRFPNVYGIDMPNPHELIAHGRSEQEVCELIGADWLLYQDLEDLKDAAREGNPAVTDFDASCFDGNYVTGDVDQLYLDHIGQLRSDGAKQLRAVAARDELQIVV
ncbi:amidophosphoribosyltransferase [Immundisolibacter sp.]|uniref:amidophosphoribosyltransferase n=1 Tax=Immundisolibacter sp. TaxID=1934948 RepID=UPI0035647E71